MPPSKKAKTAAPRAVVYLGASAPVSAVHTRMIRALLDEGHDHIFVFILCWSPDRAGVTADNGVEQLAKWLLGFPTHDRAKVQLDVVKTEGDGAKKMRQFFGPTAAPEVEVCFSQKYADQLERINSNWLPIYTKEFPSAKPRFLTDETDPGATTGTPAFVKELMLLKSPEGTVNNGSMEAWRPDQETADGWRTYLCGLLSGANGDPFYGPEELDGLQKTFFADSGVLQSLDGAWRTNRIPGGAVEYFGKLDPKSFGTFWHKMAIVRSSNGSTRERRPGPCPPLTPLACYAWLDLGLTSA